MYVKLEVSGQRANVENVVLQTDTIIGRARDCQLRIASGEISRHHCEILLADDGVYVRDLDSANGTYVNDERIDPLQNFPLQPQCRLKIGPARFVVHFEPPTRIANTQDHGIGGAFPPAADFHDDSTVDYHDGPEVLPAHPVTARQPDIPLPEEDEAAFDEPEDEPAHAEPNKDIDTVVVVSNDANTTDEPTPEEFSTDNSTEFEAETITELNYPIDGVWDTEEEELKPFPEIEDESTEEEFSFDAENTWLDEPADESDDFSESDQFDWESPIDFASDISKEIPYDEEPEEQPDDDDPSLGDFLRGLPE